MDRAVHSAAVRGVQVFDLTTDRELSAALDDVRTAVRRAGWVLTDTGRAWLRRTWWVLLGMAVIGVGRVAWVLLGGGGIDNAAALVLVAFLIVLSFRDPPATSGRGTRAIERQRRRYRYLNPSQRPAWSTYGYQAVGLSVALYGTAALWLADPEFAQSAGLYRRSSFRTVARRGGDSGGDAGDAGCGGGDGCGGRLRRGLTG